MPSPSSKSKVNALPWLSSFYKKYWYFIDYFFAILLAALLLLLSCISPIQWSAIYGTVCSASASLLGFGITSLTIFFSSVDSVLLSKLYEKPLSTQIDTLHKECIAWNSAGMILSLILNMYIFPAQLEAYLQWQMIVAVCIGVIRFIGCGFVAKSIADIVMTSKEATSNFEPGDSGADGAHEYAEDHGDD